MDHLATELILVPVRYPLEAAGVRTLDRAIELAEQVGSAHIYILYVNLIHKDERVKRADLRRAVEQTVGPIENASYHVRDAFLLEETILSESINQNVDYIVIGRERGSRWLRAFTARLTADVDLETFLRTRTDAELVVV
jgi:K+-sensing histidine kinase KdpD